MDINQIKPSAEQQTAHQYFAKPKAAVIFSAAIRPYIILLPLLLVISGFSFYLAKLWKEQPEETVVVPVETSPVARVQEAGNDFEAVNQELLAQAMNAQDSLAAIKTLQASAAGPADLTAQIHGYNQSYKVMAEPRLVLPSVENTEYPSLANYEGKILPKPKLARAENSSVINYDSQPTGRTQTDTSNSVVEQLVAEKGDVPREAEFSSLAKDMLVKHPAVEGSVVKGPVKNNALADDVLVKEYSEIAKAGGPQQKGSLNIQFNADSHLSSKLREVKRLKAQGKTSQAIRKLSALLVRYGDDWSINNTLLQIFLEERRWQDGEKMISKLQKPTHKRLAQAHYLQARGQTEEALAVLNDSRPELESLPEYYQLIATLSQRVKNFSDAEAIYKKLLLLENKNGAYWLGLASAQDALGNEKAVNSYWRARQFNAGRRGVKKYIDVRIKALSKATNTEEVASRQNGAPL